MILVVTTVNYITWALWLILTLSIAQQHGPSLYHLETPLLHSYSCLGFCGLWSPLLHISVGRVPSFNALFQTLLTAFRSQFRATSRHPVSVHSHTSPFSQLQEFSSCQSFCIPHHVFLGFQDWDLLCFKTLETGSSVMWALEPWRSWGILGISSNS